MMLTGERMRRWVGRWSLCLEVVREEEQINQSTEERKCVKGRKEPTKAYDDTTASTGTWPQLGDVKNDRVR
jgi:hypothetical protein